MNKAKATMTVPVEQAVGMVLLHDITEVVKDVRKGCAFKKGHIITAADVEVLRRLGKEHIYVLHLGPDQVHENEAALRFAKLMAGDGISFSPKPIEGKITFQAARDGLLKVNKEALFEFNLLGEVMCATLQTNTPVLSGEQAGGTRLIPLIAERQLVEKAEATLRSFGPVLEVKELRKASAGIVITGKEERSVRIEDRFEKVLREKLTGIGSEVIKVYFAPDDPERIAAAIDDCLAAGADLIVTSGGMSVDPDDVTRMGIAMAGAVDVNYGAPVLPGAMFLVGRIGTVPVLGLPACGMFHRITVLDLLLPRILTGERIGRRELAELGHGGFCRNCRQCQYPVCSFGKV